MINQRILYLPSEKLSQEDRISRGLPVNDLLHLSLNLNEVTRSNDSQAEYSEPISSSCNVDQKGIFLVQEILNHFA